MDSSADTVYQPTVRKGEGIEILLVTSPGCHLCEKAKDVLEHVSSAYPLRWREIDMASPDGSAIVRASRAPFPPVIILAGKIYGYGRLSEKKLRKDLDRLMKEV